MAKAAQSPVTKYWGTPDPRGADAYPKAASSTPMTQWAWEFLRRRSDYRNAWEKLVRPFLNGRGGFDQATIDRHYLETATSAIQERRGYRCPDPSIALQDQFRVSGESQLCNFTLDPRLERPPLFDGTYIKEVRKHNDLVKLPKVLLEFDVQLPLDLQLENARKALIRQRDRLYTSEDHKLPIGKFPLYLRLLDFHNANTPDKEIGDHLFPHYSGERLRDNIRKALAAAFRWQRDYMIIALHHPDAS